MGEEESLLEMQGVVERLAFRNETNGYTVLELNDGQDLTTVVGALPTAEPGDELHVYGVWREHPSFGRQFEAKAFERAQPRSAEAILKYLASGAVKGIGRAMAERIVRSFGAQTLEVLEQDPERLAQVPGISREKARRMGEAYQKKAGVRQILLELGEYGVTPQEAVRVFRAYGAQSVQRVRENPFCLCEEGLELSFQRADAVAEALQRPADDDARVRAGILYVLRHNLDNGHTCLPVDKLCTTAASLLGVEQARCAGQLAELYAGGAVRGCQIGDSKRAFLPRLYDAELFAASRLQMMMEYPSQAIPDAEQAVREFADEQGLRYAPEQEQAILAALSNGMLVLTGGPGTGKTTTLNAIIHILSRKGERVLLAAPTGRAAKRMSELAGEEAKTLHRMLQVEWDDSDHPSFARNEDKPLDCDALVIDELSMVDSLLFEAVLRALPLGCRLVLVGDCDQLPSVGPGCVLADLIASGMVPVVQLKHIFRQSRQSLIVTNAHRIVAGELPSLGDHSSDFFFLQRSEPDEIRDTILDLCARRLPAGYAFSPTADIQVLAPGRKGELGTMALNKQLQAVLNPPSPEKRELRVGTALFREGDKLMQCRNDYRLSWEKADGSMGEGVFNGDIGVLRAIDKAAGTLEVDMDGRTVVYDQDAAGELELAYALTVHKSQGSEFPAVVMPMYPGPRPLYYRNLFYTAVTRARKLLVLVGTQGTVRLMVHNNRRSARYTGLAAFLTGEAIFDANA